MLRNKNGEPFTPEQYDYFNKTITEDFQTGSEIEKYILNREDIKPISTFYFLLHTNNSELKNNFIRKRFEQAQHLIYEIRKRDKDYKDKTILEKVIINITKKRFKNVAIGILDKNKYTAKKILQYLIVNLNGEKYSDLHPIFITRFIKKHKSIAQKTMTNLRIRTHKFKNTASAGVFEKQLSDLYPKDTIDFDNLYKFLAVTGKLKSNKEDLTWLSELTQILVPNIYKNYKNIDKNRSDNLIEEEEIKELQNNDELMLKYVLEHIDKSNE